MALSLVYSRVPWEVEKQRCQSSASGGTTWVAGFEHCTGGSQEQPVGSQISYFSELSGNLKKKPKILVPTVEVSDSLGLSGAR